MFVAAAQPTDLPIAEAGPASLRCEREEIWFPVALEFAVITVIVPSPDTVNSICVVPIRLAFPWLNRPNLSLMSKAPFRRTRALKKKTGFRPGRSGACETRLFQFTGQAQGEGEPPVKQVAACDLHEAITYLRKWHPDLDILRVEFVAMIEIVSGSPLN
jgi:hypothetical protein